MKNYNLSKLRNLKKILLLFTGIYVFCFWNLCDSRIIENPTPDIISSTGWIALQGLNLAENQKYFDTTCEYRITIQSKTVMMPISIFKEGLGFKPSSLGRLGTINYREKHVFIMCKDGDMASKQRNDDISVLQIEERCSDYMDIYLKDKIPAMLLPNVNSSDFANLIVKMDKRIKDLEKKKSCCNNCTIL